MRSRVGLGRAILIVLLAGCTSSSPGPSTDGSLAPEAPAELLFRLALISDLGEFLPDVTLYDDGRLLTRDPDEGAISLRVLTQAGMDALLGGVSRSGWFERSHDVPLEPVPGVDPPGMGVSSDEFTIRNEDGVLITVVNVMPGAGLPYWAPSEEREALARLATQVRSLSWVPNDGWLVGNPQPFRASAFLLLSGRYEVDPPGPCAPGEEDLRCVSDVSRIAWPVPPPPAGYGSSFASADGRQVDPFDHCLVIGRPLAEAFADTIDQTGSLGVDGLGGFGETYPWRDQHGWLDVRVRPLLPEESVSCAGKNAPSLALH